MKKQRSKRKCGYCGVEGHDRRTCNKLKEQTVSYNSLYKAIGKMDAAAEPQESDVVLVAKWPNRLYPMVAM